MTERRDGGEKIPESKRPVKTESDFVAVKEKYMSQVVRKRKDQAYNINAIHACRWIHDPKCDAGSPGGVVAYTNMNNIYYGQGYPVDITKLTIFHELDHMRKGNQHRNFMSTGSVVDSLKERGKVTIRRPDRTIFFEEGFAHANSYSFYKDAYSTGDKDEDEKVFKDVKSFYERNPYKYNVDVTAKITSLLGINLPKFESLMMKRNKSGDKSLDEMFYKLTGDKAFFRKLEKRLNYYGTYIYQKNENKKPDFDSDQKAHDCQKEVDAMIVYAQKIKDGFAKKLSLFDRLFNRYGKQRRAIFACLGQKPDYSSSFYAMIDGDTTSAFSAHKAALDEMGEGTPSRDDNLMHESDVASEVEEHEEEKDEPASEEEMGKS